MIQAEGDAAGRVDWSVSVDSSIVRAHQHSAKAKRNARGLVLAAVLLWLTDLGDAS